MKDWIVTYTIDICVMAETAREAKEYARAKIRNAHVDGAEFMQIIDCGESAE